MAACASSRIARLRLLRQRQAATRTHSPIHTTRLHKRIRLPRHIVHAVHSCQRSPVPSPSRRRRPRHITLRPQPMTLRLRITVASTTMPVPHTTTRRRATHTLLKIQHTTRTIAVRRMALTPIRQRHEQIRRRCIQMIGSMLTRGRDFRATQPTLLLRLLPSPCDSATRKICMLVKTARRLLLTATTQCALSTRTISRTLATR